MHFAGSPLINKPRKCKADWMDEWLQIKANTSRKSYAPTYTHKQTPSFIFTTGFTTSTLLSFFQSFSFPFLFLFPLQGGRQVTAVGGRQACHMLLCLGLHQNIPPHAALATAFPFNHHTVVWRKWQHSWVFSRLVFSSASTKGHNFPLLGMIHGLLSYTGLLMFIFDFYWS